MYSIREYINNDSLNQANCAGIYFVLEFYFLYYIFYIISNEQQHHLLKILQLFSPLRSSIDQIGFLY